MSQKKVMEAALFISSTPLTLDQLARVTGINSLGHVKELVDSLKKDYEKSGLEIFSSADGYTIQVRPQLLPKVAHLTPYSDLAEGPKRTLALVTLREPVKQSEIIKIQGNKAYTYIKDLKKRGLVVTEKQGHTKILKLTQEFERYFGEEKEKVKEQLQRHLEATGKGGEPVYEEDGPEEPPREDRYLGDKPPKEKASAIKDDAAKEVKKGDEFGSEDDEEDEPEDEEERKLKASHDHAFEEIE